MDSPAARSPAIQKRLRDIAIKTNEWAAGVLGINPSAAITSVKPSGNSGVLLDCAPGINSRWSKYYVRNVRVNATSPMLDVLRDAGVNLAPENGQTPDNARMWVASFPVASPEGTVIDSTAKYQCMYYWQTLTHWAEHNPSVTVTYNDDEVIDIMKFVTQFAGSIVGMTFLPKSDVAYEQMPYVAIDEDEYERLAAEFPKINFAKLYRYETRDTSEASSLVACTSDKCSIPLAK